MAKDAKDNTTAAPPEGGNAVEAVPDAALPRDDDSTSGRSKRLRRRPRGWMLVLSAFGAVLTFAVFVLVVGLLSVMGRSVDLPQWAVDRVEARLNADAGGDDIQLEAISVGLRDRAYRPTVDVRGVQLFNAAGEPLLQLPSLRSKLDTSELIQGRIKLETLELTGASLDLTRDASGQIALAFGAQMGGQQVEAGSVAEVFTQVDKWFADPRLEELEEVSADALSIRLTDERSGEQTVVEQGRLSLVNSPNVIALNVSFDLDQPGEEPANLLFSADKAKGLQGGRLVGKFTNLSARGLAQQVAALNFLNVLDAPVSGALTAEIDGAGKVAALAGTLDIAKGELRPNEQAKPVEFNSAKAYIRYDQSTGRLQFDDISLDAPELRLNASGHADLLDFASGIPQTLLGQLRFSNIRLAPEGMFEAPVVYQSGVLDLRYRPAELEMDVGQLLLRNDDVNLLAKGSVRVLPQGWSVSMDAGIDRIDHAQLMSLWPEAAVPKTRAWLIKNIIEGEVQNAAASIRITPDRPMNAAVSFDFDQARVRYLKTLPPIEKARGYVAITGKTFDLAVQDGQIATAGTGALQAAGSVMQLPDMTENPVVAEIDLRLEGPLSAALNLLDRPPFEFLSKSGLQPDVASGLARIDTRLTVPFMEHVDLNDLGYAVSAEVVDVQSTTLIKDRLLTSDLMKVTAGDGALSIAGNGALDDVPIDVVWARKIGPDSTPDSMVTGTIELSPRSLAAFNVGLPKGMVSGSGTGQIEVSLARGRAPVVDLQSSLEGVGLAIPALGWSKSRAARGSLQVGLTMGPSAVVNSFSLTAPGLETKGTVSLKPGGGLDRAVLESLRVAGKLNSRVEVVGQGANRPARLVIRGGTIDIRNFGVTSDGGGTSGPPLDLALDRLVVTDTISLDQFQGSFRNDNGLDGTFKANLNGTAAVSGVVVPTASGPAIRIQSNNGGRVVAASGIFRNANGGDMSLTLQPNGKPGQFDGALDITNTRVKKAPALADLLSAISVIGLLEQLSGDGILFSNVEARFLLTPGGVTLRRSSAVGPSMGITMDGIYNTSTRQLNMQGVVSPIYAVNGLFGALFAPRKGEGLFGFNYSLKGPADGPSVGVNPLSVLTPGIFREIFRQPPPKLQN